MDCSRGDRSAYPRMAPRNKSMERKTYTLASITGSTMAFSQRPGSRCAARIAERSQCLVFLRRKNRKLWQSSPRVNREKSRNGSNPP